MVFEGKISRRVFGPAKGRGDCEKRNDNESEKPSQGGKEHRWTRNQEPKITAARPGENPL